MIKMACLLLLQIIIALVAESAQADHFIPSDPNKPGFIYAITQRPVPNIRLYPTRDVKGKPALELNEKGLFENGKLLCKWPKDMTKAADRVLIPVSGGEKCAEGYPIISTWSDGGIGAAELKVEFDNIVAEVVEFSRKGKKLYAKSDDFKSWGRYEAPSESRKKHLKIYQDTLKTDKNLQQFITEIETCIRGENRACIKKIIMWPAPGYSDDWKEFLRASPINCRDEKPSNRCKKLEPWLNKVYFKLMRKCFPPQEGRVFAQLGPKGPLGFVLGDEFIYCSIGKKEDHTWAISSFRPLLDSPELVMDEPMPDVENEENGGK